MKLKKNPKQRKTSQKKEDHNIIEFFSPLFF
jgi:hypothetical protein